MTILLKKDAQQFIERNSGSCRQLLGWSWLEIWKYKPPLVTTQSCPAQNLYPLIKIFQYLIDLGNWSLHISRTLISIDLVMGRPRLPKPPSPFRRPRRSELSANNKQLVNFKKMYRIYQFSSYAVKISFAAFYIQQFDWLLLTAFENFQTTSRNTTKFYNTLFSTVSMCFMCKTWYTYTCKLCILIYVQFLWRHHLCMNRQDLNLLKVELLGLCVKCPAVADAPGTYHDRVLVNLD